MVNSFRRNSRRTNTTKTDSQRSEDIVALKSDEGGAVVVINSADYHNKMSEILNDCETYNNIQKEKDLCVKQEKHVARNVRCRRTEKVFTPKGSCTLAIMAFRKYTKQDIHKDLLCPSLTLLTIQIFIKPSETSDSWIAYLMKNPKEFVNREVSIPED